MFGPSYFGTSYFGPTYFPPGELLEIAETGGGWFSPASKYFDIRDLDYLYEPQEPVTEVIEAVDIEYQPPEKLIQRSPIEFRAPPVSKIEDATEREIAVLMRKLAIAKHASRAIKQAEKERLFKKNLAVMIALLLDEV